MGNPVNAGRHCLAVSARATEDGLIKSSGSRFLVADALPRLSGRKRAGRALAVSQSWWRTVVGQKPAVSSRRRTKQGSMPEQKV